MTFQRGNRPRRLVTLVTEYFWRRFQLGLSSESIGPVL